MRLSSLVMSTLALTACASGSTGSATTPSPASQGAPAMESAGAAANGPAYNASLQPMNASGTRIVGMLKLSPTKPGEYHADLSIRNAGGMQNKFPWIIRTGQCGETNSATELGNPVSYRMLETGSDGSARVSAPLKVPLTPGGVYHVDILKSPNERTTVVACGVLSAS